MSSLLRLQVNIPVELYYEPLLVTAEVGDETLDRELSTELETEKPPPSQTLPKKDLGFRLLRPQFPDPPHCPGF